jgi:hypothetical protein
VPVRPRVTSLFRERRSSFFSALLFFCCPPRFRHGWRYFARCRGKCGGGIVSTGKCGTAGLGLSVRSLQLPRSVHASFPEDARCTRLTSRFDSAMSCIGKEAIRSHRIQAERSAAVCRLGRKKIESVTASLF